MYATKSKSKCPIELSTWLVGRTRDVPGAWDLVMIMLKVTVAMMTKNGALV